MKNKYQVVNGTSYHADTSVEVIEVLERIKGKNQRVRFHWGNAETGLDWGDIYDVAGTIGNSTGVSKVPLLIQKRNSLGGCHFLDHCIVKITTTVNNTKGFKTVLYQHTNYHRKEV